MKNNKKRSNVVFRKVDKVNAKSFTNNSFKKLKKVNVNKRRQKIINELSIQSKFLHSYILRVYLYVFIHEQIINSLFLHKKTQLDLILNAYLLKMHLIKSMEDLLLTNILNFVNNYFISEHINKTINKDIHINTFYTKFYFKGSLLYNFYKYYDKTNFFNNQKNYNNFFNIIFEYLYLSIRIRHTNWLFNFLNNNNNLKIILNTQTYHYNNSYERYYNYINHIKILLYNKQSNIYNVSLKLNVTFIKLPFNIVPYQLFDTNYFVMNTYFRKNFNYDISTLHICLLNNYIKKKNFFFFFSLVCLLYTWSICIKYFTLLMEEEYIVFGNYKKEVLRYHLS